MFAYINEEIIRKAAIKTKRGSGHSTDGWRRIICSNNSDDTKADLRKAIANFINIFFTEEASTVSIQAFVACWLISLEKNPSLWQTGIGEILCRILGKLIESVLMKEVVSSAGSLQVCTGQDIGSKAAIHAMEEIFQRGINRVSFTSWCHKCL